MAWEKKDSEIFAIRKVEFVIGWQGKRRIREILPSENEICEFDGKKPGEPRKMLPSENEISGLDGKKPGEPRKMLPSENEISGLDGKAQASVDHIHVGIQV